ncbi:MAG: SGNH/GDSL hydrolase family protein [Planctomycetota bacterium]
MSLVYQNLKSLLLLYFTPATKTPITFLFLSFIAVTTITCSGSFNLETTAISEPSPSEQEKQQPLTPIQDTPGLPRVLLIGDSISIGYTIPVRNMLKGEANVHRPSTNCGPTTKGIEQIEDWLGDGNWDVIHFNFGLHDLKYMGPKGEHLADPKLPTSHPQVPLDQYEQNLEKLVQRLRQTNAKLIWRNTTPVPPGARGRIVGDAKKYNDVAKKIMDEAGISIDDHFRFSLENMKEIQRPKNVHFTPAGSRKLAELAVKAIRTALKNQQTSNSGGEVP